MNTFRIKHSAGWLVGWFSGGLGRGKKRISPQRHISIDILEPAFLFSLSLLSWEKHYETVESIILRGEFFSPFAWRNCNSYTHHSRRVRCKKEEKLRQKHERRNSGRTRGYKNKCASSFRCSCISLRRVFFTVSKMREKYAAHPDKLNFVRCTPSFSLTLSEQDGNGS